MNYGFTNVAAACPKLIVADCDFNTDEIIRLAKKAEKLAEDSKVAVRNVRRDANEKAKEMKKNGEMTEDELKASEKSIQDLTDKYVKNIDTVAEAKKKEIMSI